MGPIVKFPMERLEKMPLPSTKERFTSELKKAKVSVTGVCGCDNKQATPAGLDDGLPKFRTQLYMLQKIRGVERRMNVVFSVYATCYDVYAVVSQDRNIIVKDCGYIKLRNCNVLFDDVTQTLEISQKRFEGVPLKFKAMRPEQLQQLRRWLQLDDNDNVSSCGVTSLQKSKRAYLTSSPRVSPNQRRKTSLPVLSEDDEVDAAPVTSPARRKSDQTVPVTSSNAIREE